VEKSLNKSGSDLSGEEELDKKKTKIKHKEEVAHH
jgi:hypothetical protein